MSTSSNISNKKEVVSIVDFILNERGKEKAEAAKAQLPEVITITAANFFKEDNPTGVSTIAEFQASINVCGIKELRGLEYLLKSMSNDVKINAPAFPIPDKDGNEALYCHKHGKKGSSDFKVLAFGELVKFLDLYQFELAKFSVTLDELYKRVK